MNRNYVDKKIQKIIKEMHEFTYKKSLQKITESYRVDKEMKKIIKEMRQRG